MRLRFDAQSTDGAIETVPFARIASLFKRPASPTGGPLRWAGLLLDSAKDDARRSGESGVYAGVDGELGYSICMLRRRRMNSWYRDPFLSAIYHEIASPKALEFPKFTGYETNERWLVSSGSGFGIRCIDAGFELRVPEDPTQAQEFERICAPFGGADGLLRIPKSGVEPELDRVDRVELAVELLRTLLDAGL